MPKAPQNAVKVPVELRWSDQDLFGHINNARIMTVVEEARVRVVGQTLRQAGLSETPSTVLRTMETHFTYPLMYPATTIVRVWISKIGRTSYTLHHEVSQGTKVCVTCDAVMVNFSAETQTSTAIPDDVRAALATIVADNTSV